MQPGIYPDISNENYHTGPGVSKSGLDLIERTPMHYDAAQRAEYDSDSTRAQELGKALHCLVLEPHLFIHEYTLALRPQDVPDAIVERDQLANLVAAVNHGREKLAAGTIRSRDELISMVNKANETRRQKLSTSGTKDELILRIREAMSIADGVTVVIPSAEEKGFSEVDIYAVKQSELKAMIEQINQGRPGLLSTTGTMDQLAATLRSAGHEFKLFTEVADEWTKKNGGDFILSDKGSMQDMAAALRAAGHTVTLWQDVKAEWQENNGHRTVLSQENWDKLQGMRDAILAHPAACKLLTGCPGKAEQSVYWVDEDTGELCRCRPDYWRNDGVLLDLKATNDASPEGFSRHVSNFRYHLQHPFYLDGIAAAIEQMHHDSMEDAFPPELPKKPHAFVFVCVETEYPHAVACYQLDKISIEMGRAEYRKNLNTFHHCRKTNEWPGYGDIIQPASLPGYHLSRKAYLLETE